MLLRRYIVLQQACAVVKHDLQVHMMDIVAEMMIFANAAVARRIADSYPGAALLRNHPAPREEAFEQVGAGLLIQLHAPHCVYPPGLVHAACTAFCVPSRLSAEF